MAEETDSFGTDGSFLEDILPTLYVILPDEQIMPFYRPSVCREMYKCVKMIEYKRSN